MIGTRRTRKAPSGAFLLSGYLMRSLVVFWLLLAAASAPAEAMSCRAPADARQATVRYVYDGDTVRLASGERVRLAGIDAPEVAHSGKAGEPFGDASRQALRAMLAKTHNRLLVVPGRDSHDHYGRLLAYLFLPDGRSIQAALIDRGMAMAIYMPPNLRYADCLTAHEQAARAARHGIWSSPEYEPGVPTTAIPKDVKGAAIVRGKLLSVGRSRHYIWLNLAGRVALQISRRHLDRFDGIDFDRWVGQTLRARGWLVAHHNRYEDWLMPIESPRSVTVLK